MNVNGSELTSPRETARHWVALIGAMLGAFMAVLDIQITNASLNDILGSLGATLEEGSWVSTSYLVAEIIVIPLTGWLSDVFSPRRYLLANAALFLVFSWPAPGSWNLDSMIVFPRAARFHRRRAHPDGVQPRAQASAAGQARAWVSHCSA